MRVCLNKKWKQVYSLNILWFWFQVNWSCFYEYCNIFMGKQSKNWQKIWYFAGQPVCCHIIVFLKVTFACYSKILSRHCLLRLFLHLCYICRVIVFSLRVQNSESFCWPSWSMQSWHATGQADLPSLRWGNNRASFITAIKSWCTYEQLKPDKILLCHNLWMVNPYVVLGSPRLQI